MKDETTVIYKIKITRVRSCNKNGHGIEYEDKLFFVEAIDYVGNGISFASPTLKEALKNLSKELW